MSIKNFKLATRMAAGFGVLLLFMLLISFVGLKNMNNIKGALEQIYHTNSAKMILAYEMRDAAHTIDTQIGNLLLAKEKSAKQVAVTNIDAAREQYAQAFNQIKEIENTEEGRQLLDKLEQANLINGEINDRAIKLDLAGNFEEAHEVVNNEVIPAMAEILRLLDDIVALQQERSQFRYEESVSAYQSSRVAMLTFGGLALLLGILIALYITRSIVRPVNRLAVAAQTVATGDLTVEIKEDGRDEIGQLAQAFRQMLAQMRQLVGHAIEKGVEVAESAKYLSASAEEASAGANETASTMSQIAANVEQISANIQEVLAASTIANQHASSGSQGVDNVTKQMVTISNSTQQTAGVIENLSQTSQRISQIVEMITNIADQTNLLALNAAIEAARAGEQGRGFAVVAEEVRKLAEQSANAASEIKELIAAIQAESQRAVDTMAVSGKEVEAGALVVQEVGQSFGQIISAVEELTDQIKQVSEASEQMSSGVQNVTAATEEQTAAVEEVASSAEHLNKLSVELDDLVRKFKT